MLHDAFARALEAHGVRDRAELVWQSCFGRCTQGPNVLVREVLTVEPPALGTGFATLPGPRGSTALYNRMDEARTERVVAQHVLGGQIARDLIEPPGGIRPIDPVASSRRNS
ncbi:MAG: hypothetical protein KIT31_23405 [Deltaproteobacteria bacterium]|nr:hypothetical protein [Deltaproteobacteria bacterium]